MDFRSLLVKKEPSPQQMMKQEQEFRQENIVTENATQTTGVEEQYLADHKERFADLRRWQQDLSPKFRNLFEKFAGYRIDDTGEIVAIPHIKPRMNINGAYHIISFLEVNDVNTIMSNYSEIRVGLSLRYGIGYPLVQFIKDNREEFDIEKSFGDLRYIVSMCLNATEPTFFRALNAGERNADSKIYKIQSTQIEGKKEERKGILSAK